MSSGKRSAVGENVFMMLGSGKPIFELAEEGAKTKDAGPLSYHFSLHAALDMVDEQVWRNSQMHLKRVDSFQGKWISAYVTGSNVTMLLLHGEKADENIAFFFREVHELYVKCSMNPFYKHGDPVMSREFRQRVAKLFRSLNA